MNKEFGKKELTKIKKKLDIEMVLRRETTDHYEYMKSTYKSCSICNTIGYYDLLLFVEKDVELVRVEVGEKYDGNDSGEIVSEFNYEQPIIDTINNIIENFKEYVEIKVCKCSFCFDESGVRTDDQV